MAITSSHQTYSRTMGGSNFNIPKIAEISTSVRPLIFNTMTLILKNLTSWPRNLKCCFNLFCKVVTVFLSFRLVVIASFILTHLTSWDGPNVGIVRKHRGLVNSRIPIYRNFCDFGNIWSLTHPMLVNMSDERMLWPSNEAQNITLREYTKFCVYL